MNADGVLNLSMRTSRDGSMDSLRDPGPDCLRVDEPCSEERVGRMELCMEIDGRGYKVVERTAVVFICAPSPSSGQRPLVHRRARSEA